MRVELNLAVCPSVREQYALYWTVPLALIAVVSFILVASRAAGQFRGYGRIQAEVAKRQAEFTSLEQQEKELQKKFEQPQYRETARQARFVNSLIARKRLSFTDLADKATRLLPVDVHLTGLAMSLDQDEPAVRLAVVGRSEELLEDFLKALQDSPDFTEAAIVSQNPQPSPSIGGGVSMVASARYVGGKAR